MAFTTTMLVAVAMLETLLLLTGSEATESIGICYGRVANNLPPAQEVVDLYKANGIGRMRIYNPDPSTIEALKSSNVELSIGVPNEEIQSLGTSLSSATDWVRDNIQIHSSDINFRYIIVGNEIMPDDEQAQYVVPAMQNIYQALVSFNLHDKIKVSTAIQISLLGNSYPPSAGSFSNSSIQYVQGIVSVLKDRDSPLLVNLYTYFSYIGDMKDITLDFALFTSSTSQVMDGQLSYQNLFVATLDALYAALDKIGAPELEVVISESGWPSDGGVAATVSNAKTYYQNLINNVGKGTPRRPNQAVETYLFSMFDENQKGPAETEKHFGLFTPDKQSKYQITFMEPHSKSSANVIKEKLFLVFFVAFVFVLVFA